MDEETAATFKKFKCELCPMRTFHKFKLTEHVNAVHRKLKPFSCPVEGCDYKTGTRKLLWCHNRDKHVQNKSLLLFLCEQCSYRARSAHALRKHSEARHTPRDSFRCESCDFKTRCEKYLQRHRDSIHLGKKKYFCEQCPFASNYQQHLSRHMDNCHNYNSSKKEHGCPYCSYVTCRKDNLKKHVVAVHKMNL